MTYRLTSILRELAARSGSPLFRLSSKRAVTLFIWSLFPSVSKIAGIYITYSPAAAHFSRRSSGYSRSSASQEAIPSSIFRASNSFRRSSSSASISPCSNAGRKSSRPSTVVPSIRARGHSMATSGIAAPVSHLLTAALVTPRAAAICSWVRSFSRRSRWMRFPISMILFLVFPRGVPLFSGPSSMVARQRPFRNGGAVEFRCQFFNRRSSRPPVSSGSAPGPAGHTAFPAGAPRPGCGTAPPR